MRKQSAWLGLAMLFCLSSSVSWGQSDSVFVTEKASIKYKKPSQLGITGFRVGMDTYPLFWSLMDADFLGINGHFGINLNDRIWLSSDIGFVNTERKRSTSPFYNNQTTGTFFRVGADYNTSYWKTASGAALCIGLHYGRSTFDNTVTNPSLNTTWGNAIEVIDSKSIKGSWLEPRFTLQVNAIPQISLAAILGLRIRTSLNNYQAYPNEIPGYGVIKSRTMLFFGYRICYEWNKEGNKNTRPPLREK